ncbi:MAG TPA: response regulator [Dissulfurispiraceae bacterium]|nr:response regulator [Dissulfurispiraceae bacterium]
MMTERILVIDDEPDMLKYISMILRETESQVVTTSDPLEAVELARLGGYDVVITDLKMPGLDGIELLNSIRNFNSDIPVIIITAYATAEAAADAMSNAAFDFITKPFRKEQLLFSLDKAFRWLKIKRENDLLREMLAQK